MASEAHPQQLIIVRRHDEEEHDPHSSAWKVAHADFMTAMMAFFLIMWLINVTDDEVKKSIANYFNPVKLSESLTNRKGLNSRDVIEPQGPEKPGDEKVTLSPPSATKQPGDSGADHKSSEKPPENSSAGAAPHNPAAEAEEAAFRDPYTVLDKLAAEVPPRAVADGDAAIAETGHHATVGSDVSRDPFDPVYWQMRQAAESRTNTPGPPGKAQRIPAGKPDATALTSAESGTENTVAIRPSLSADAPALTDMAPATRMEAAAVEAKLIAAIASRLHADAPHIEVKATEEGIVINLTDDAKFSMFEIGSAIPKPAVVVAMEKVAEVLTEQPGDIIIRGYTDGRPFHSDTYDNWRLSTARAHMAYYMLTRGGLQDARIVRIEGRADRDLKNPADPNAAENRRIEILLRGRPS